MSQITSGIRSILSNPYFYEFFHKITNVHLKDRIYGGNSVCNFEGDTDFDEIFRTLSKFKYDNLFTL